MNRSEMKNFVNRSIHSVIQSFHGQLDSLSTDDTTIAYVSDLLFDLDITRDEKQETIQGILELNRSTSNSTETDDDHHIPKTIQGSVEDLIERVHIYLSNPTVDSEEKIQSTSSRETSTKSTSSSSASTNKAEGESLKPLSAEIKKAIVNNYGQVEIDKSSLKEIIHPPPNGKLKETFGLAINQDSFGDDVPKDLLDEEVKLLDVKKRQRKKIESKKYANIDDILLRPNLNTKLVDHENKLKKQELSEKHKLKIQKDKADLIKQRENQEKKKMEARLKARKLERRA